jgi:DNA-binding XRE family transcriptional regulator
MMQGKEMSLREWRQSIGMTQGELAKKANVSRAAISHVETARVEPTAQFARKICAAFSNMLGYRVCNWHVFPAHFKPLPGPTRKPEASQHSVRRHPSRPDGSTSA